MWATMATWFFVLVVLLQSVHAQIVSEATCLPTFSILANSRGQDACLIAAYAQGACTGGQWTVPVLAADRHYTGPKKENINSCQCSTVVYDLISACALCQGRLFITWTGWATNCTTGFISLGEYPVPIPPATAIPAWAYWNPVGNGDLFSLAAVSGAQGPESSAAPPPPPTKISTGTYLPPPTSSPQTQAPPDSSSSSSSNIGAIVGGVVGGVFVIGLIAVFIVWLVKRKDSSTPPPAQYNGYPNMATTGSPTHPGLLGTPSSHPGSIPATWSPSPPSGYSQSGLRPYDPSDPSTHYSIHPNTRPQYPGVAELHTEDYGNLRQA